MFQTFFCNLMSSIIFCNFTNCSSRQIVCKLLWWIFCLQIVILDNFFLQIIDLNNFLLQIVIVIFFTNCRSSYIYLKIVHLDNLFAICHLVNHLANCCFRQFFYPNLQIVVLGNFFATSGFRQMVSVKVVRVDQEDRSSTRLWYVSMISQDDNTKKIYGLHGQIIEPSPPFPSFSENHFAIFL